MKGTILDYTAVAREGAISGDDGNRYSFRLADWSAERMPAAGVAVDFVADNGVAKQIYAVVTTTNSKSRIAAALLAFFLGAFGVHKFYLGYNSAGIVMLLVFLFGFVLLGLPSFVIGVIAFIEFIIYLLKSDADFERIYVLNKRAWF